MFSCCRVNFFFLAGSVYVSAGLCNVDFALLIPKSDSAGLSAL